MIIHDPVTGHTKGVCDACIDPHRANCRGCDYNFIPSLFDGGCTKGTAYEGMHFPEGAFKLTMADFKL